MRCEGRTAIVTGAAGKGMGRSIALTLAREGANVVVNYLTSGDSAASIVGYIEEQGGRAMACKADVMDKEACTQLVDAAADAYGKVDICIIGPGAGWHPEPPDKVNVEGALDDAQSELAPVYNLMPLVLPGMYERKWGRMITLALSPPYNCPSYAYNVAKAARVHGFLCARDAAWENGVTLNVIGPGPVPPIDTLDLAVEQCGHGPAWQGRETSSPQDIAEMVAFLCSDAGDYVSGAVIPYAFR